MSEPLPPPPRGCDLIDIIEPIVRSAEASSIDSIEIPTVYVVQVIAELRAERAAHARLRGACNALLNAPHQEHFAVRLNDPEMAAFDEIKAALAAGEGKA